MRLGHVFGDEEIETETAEDRMIGGFALLKAIEDEPQQPGSMPMPWSGDRDNETSRRSSLRGDANGAARSRKFDRVLHEIPKHLLEPQRGRMLVKSLRSPRP